MEIAAHFHGLHMENIMRSLNELVFSVTNRCTARCNDCPIVHEGKPPATLGSGDMIKIIEEVLPWGTLKLVVFTGGEPFLLGDDLRETVAFAASHNLLTRIVTNTYWAATREKAVELLQSYKDAGLTELNFSCDDYHQEYVPLDCVKNANEAALQVGLPALIAHRLCPGGTISIDYLSEYFGVRLREYKRGKDNPKNNVYESGVNVPIYSKQWDRQSKQRGSWNHPCPIVLNKIIISPEKHVQICCGIASSSIEVFNIGNLNEDQSLLHILKEGNEDLMTNWLALAGPESIYEFVLEKCPEIELPHDFINRCHLCHELFTRPDVLDILREHALEKAGMVSVMRTVLDWLTDDLAPTLLINDSSS